MTQQQCFEITRRIEIDAAHRIPDHGSKCKNLHGHRYVVEATARGSLVESGEETGMVMDFSFLKTAMMRFVYEQCDHGMILWMYDPLFDTILECAHKIKIVADVPTAENLAKLWYDEISSEVDIITEGRAQLARIRVYETPNCWADYPIL